MTDNRKAWTNQEDHAICTLVKKHGTHRWSEISKRMADHFGNPGRTGKQCRQRWHNHLNPKINKSAWTDEQQRILFQCHQEYGNKWKSIAAHLKGRTDNDIKNKFYSSMRKKLRKINKMLGVKNSTSQVRQIKPKVLSNIINASSSTDQNVQQAWQELSKLIFCKDDKKLQKMIKGQDRQKIIQLVQKISSINDNYLETKDTEKVASKKESIQKVEQEQEDEVRQIKQKSKARSRRISLRKRQSNLSLSKMNKKTSVSQNPVIENEPNFNFSLSFSQAYSPGFLSSFTPVLGRKSSIISNNNNNNEKEMEEWRDLFLNSPRMTRSFIRTPIPLTPGTSMMSSSGLLAPDIKDTGFAKPETYDEIQKTIQTLVQRNTIGRQ